MHLRKYLGCNMVPREDFPPSIEKDLLRLENNAGFQFHSRGWKVGFNYLVPGTSMEGSDVEYERDASGKRYLWNHGERLKLHEALEDLEAVFHGRLEWVRSRGEGLEKLGVSTKDLEFNEVVKLEDLFEEMGIDIPESMDESINTCDPEFPNERKKKLSHQWTDYYKRQVGEGND